MNQHLQKIQDFLQQAETLSAEEKAALTKAVSKADTDLALTEFKLDRTEKVKRTTAILLEETIEELEQKRKTVEDKNHDLEVEASLERVRAVAMGMRKPDDMLDICRVICSQLEALNVKDIRNVQTAIIYEFKELYVNYEYYRLHDKALITEVAYDDHPIQAAFVKQMLEGPGAFFSRNIQGDAVRDFFEYQKTTNVFIDDNLADASSLNYYWYSMGPVALGLSTYSPLSQSDLEIFERFRNVFGLAYTRYLDIETALAQAREAQIQLALERVRARTMAMHSSSELAEASHLLEEQVTALGIKTWGCAFNIFRENDSIEWFSNMPTYVVPRENIWQQYYDACQRGETLYIKEFEGDACTAHYEYLCTIPILGDALLKTKASGTPFPAYQLDHVAPFKYGYLMFITFEPVPEAHDIFRRFAKVFEQTYTRFLDLQKAEAQAIQAEQDLIEIKAARKRAEDTLMELRATQKQLIQSEKMASLGELTAGIAHEIQNPLNFVNNFSEVSAELIDEMEEELSKGDTKEAIAIASDIKQNLEKIRHHGKRADGIVKGMLQHSRAGSNVKEPTDINKLADEYLRLAYHGLRAKDKNFNAELVTSYDISLPKIEVVPQDIGRAILNMLNNAFYATQQKAINAGSDYKPEITVTTITENEQAIIKVKDNGNGIPAGIRDKIMQPFFTTKPTGEGTGLGLSLSYDIVVKGHGGKIDVDSKDGEGSEFLIILPF